MPYPQSTGIVLEESSASAARSAPEARTLRPAADFESLFAAVAGTAFGIAVRLTRNQADAEDLVQEAALLAFRAFASFEPGTNFRAWFFKILTNCYFSKRRREKSRPVTSDLDDTPDLYLYARSAEAGFPTQGPDPAAQLLDQLGTERVVAAIARLPEEYRVVSTLVFHGRLELRGDRPGAGLSRRHRALPAAPRTEDAAEGAVAGR